MSITTKNFLIKEIEDELQNNFNSTNHFAIEETLNKILSNYQIEELSNVNFQKNNDEIVNSFLEAKELEGRTQTTLTHYNYVINRMLEDINIPIQQITIIHLRSYLKKNKENGISDKTLSGIRNVIRSFFSWVEKEGLIEKNPCNNLMPIRYEKKIKEPYSETDIEKLKEACSTVRDKALISFMLSTGCRISEICLLNKDDINFQTKECIVYGKGRKERIVFFDDITKMYLEKYLSERKDTCKSLFITRLGERITPAGTRFILNSIGKKANVENVHPHRFRRTLATNLILHGMPIQEVANILGHEKLDTTMTYICMNKNMIKNSYEKYS